MKLGGHRGRDGKCMCNLCGEDYESVGHFLWNCLAYLDFQRDGRNGEDDDDDDDA